ncbi:MAG: multidrug resistance efflux transporter family protein [Oscillospiraceae bacterium]
MKKALFYGILSSMFFAFTFVLNRTMNLSGGSWYWSGILRFLFKIPILYFILLKNNQIKDTIKEIRSNRKAWYLWSTVGFGVFYSTLSLASIFGESWLICGTWQITMVTGALMTPFFGGKIPVKNVFICLFVLVGVFLMQLEHAVNISLVNSIFCVLAILIAAIAYPLGNRKTMILSGNRLTTTQRVFAMTICCAPFWFVLSIIALFRVSLPPPTQIYQSILVSIFSGVIATLLYFHATDMVKDNPRNLAVVEATIAGEVVFTLIGGIIFAGDKLPGSIGFLGLGIVVIGMVLNSIVGKTKE